MEFKEILNQWEFRAAACGIIVFGSGFIAGAFFESELFILSLIGWLGVFFVVSLLILSITIVLTGVWQQVFDAKHTKEFIRSAVLEKLKREQEKEDDKK